MSKFYITTALPYINSDPHIGFALEIIQADVLARYHRILGDNVFFLTGTGEHGLKNAKKAEREGLEPKDFADRNSKKFFELAKALFISNDDFIRTTDQKRHWPSVIKAWNKLLENNDIYLKEYSGLYCSGCEAFLTEKDLIDGKCPIHHRKPEPVKENNYFFRLSKYSKRIKEAIIQERIKIIPETRKNEVISFINQGLEDISFSRPRSKLKWGIPVPNDPDQTIYVWLDALINYISALGYDKNSPRFYIYWPADVHCIGKDILRFHAIYWPAILLALDLPLPKTIFVHGYITVGGQKMSKSLGNVVDPFEIVRKYGPDALRYFLLREGSSFEDIDFTEEKFRERYNSDLAKGLGNLVSRIVTLRAKLGLTKGKIAHTRRDPEIDKMLKEIKKRYKENLNSFKFNEALKSVWELITVCDRYIERERPWESRSQKVINNLLFCLSEIARLLKPFLPASSKEILNQIQGKNIKPLFPRI